MVSLIINVCAERLHNYEFIKPLEEILSIGGVKFRTIHYKQLSKADFTNASNIIICGTSLKDNEFLKDIKKFEWIRSFERPVLGICAGMQVIGMIYGGKIKKGTEIGFYFENFEKKFLGLVGNQEVYHLHNNFVDFKKLKEFEIACENENVVQAVKHKEKEIYGVLFHPEVRQKQLILAFAKN